MEEPSHAARSLERRRAVRVAASLADLEECLASERDAEARGARCPPPQTTSRKRYVALRPPKAAASPPGAAEDDDAWLPRRAKHPRLGGEYQATRLPPYAPTQRRVAVPVPSLCAQPRSPSCAQTAAGRGAARRGGAGGRRRERRGGCRGAGAARVAANAVPPHGSPSRPPCLRHSRR